MRVDVRQHALEQAKVHAAREVQIETPVLVEPGRSAELQIGVRSVQMGLIDSNCIAAVGEADVLVVRKLNEFIIERNSSDVRVDLDGIRLAQRAGDREDAVGGAMAGD